MTYSKNITGILLFLFAFNIGTAQNGGDEPDFYTGELSKMINIPNSPEAQAFAKYGDVQVNMYSGVPQISIPLHQIDGRELSLPFSLSYDASGVQVEQMATWVGLSWNLNVGGRISRTVNGLPDDFITGTYQTMFNHQPTYLKAKDYIDNKANLLNPTFSSEAAAREYVEFLYDINTNYIDTQQDYFTLNVMGLNETIIFDNNGITNIPKVLNNPRIKVAPQMSATGYIAGWKVTGDDGTQYFFDEIEETIRTNAGDNMPMGDLGNTHYISSWLLTKIISSNKKDVYEFSYKNEGFRNNPTFASSAGVATTEILTNVFYYSEPPLSPGSSVSSQNKPKYLTSITHNQDLMATINFGSRFDMANTAVNARLTTIDFFDNEGNDLKSITFDNNDYFNLDSANPSNLGGSNKTSYDVRLKLNGLAIKGKDATTYQTYAFEYDRPDDLPSRNSYSQDYLGYYNGAGNSTLYTSYESSNLTFAGANREPDSYHGRTGILKKVTYPTKGYTTYTYESHDEFKVVYNEATDAILDVQLNASSITNPNLYYDDNGQLCDDAFLGQNPKIVIQTFRVFEDDTYSLNFSALGNAEAYIVDPLIVPHTYKNYCDFYAGPGPNLLWSATSPTTQNINLTVGKYKVLLILGENPLTGNYGNAFLGITRDLITTNRVNVQVGGNRISKIRDYSSDGNLERTKSYTYRDSNNESTGSINYKPILFDTRAGNSSTGSKTQLIRYGTYPKGNEPYVVYCSVSETLLDGQGNSQGKTVYTFHDGQKGMVPRLEAPYENNYLPSLKIGSVKRKEVFKEDGTQVLKEETDFYETPLRPVKVKGLAVFSEEENFGKTIFIKGWNQEQPSEYYTLEYLPNFECPSGLCAVPDYFVNPGNYGYTGFMDPKFSPFRGRVNFANGAHGGPSYTKTASFLENGQGNLISVSTQDTTVYDTSLGSLYRPRLKRSIDSKGDTYETTYSYADDVSGGANALLVSKNNITEIVKTETVKNPSTEALLVTARENFYQSFASGVALPISVKTKKGSYAQENRIAFDFYSNGNLKTSKKEDGATTVYLWGYDAMYPIAKIENATYTQVAAALGISETALNAYNEVNLNSINNLRTSLLNSMITTYEYLPMIGVSKITDPRGYTITYNYDNFNRLESVKDADGNLVTDYEYHYKNQ